MSEFIVLAKEVVESVKWAFEHLWAWIMYGIVFLGSFLGDTGVMYVHCLLASLVADFIVGIWKSVKQGGGFSTKKAGKFLVKGIVYISFMVLVHVVDIILAEDTVVCMKGVALVGVVTELWSVLCNLAIIFPQFAVLPIVQKFLLTTISEKLNISEDELKDRIEKVKDPNDETVDLNGMKKKKPIPDDSIPDDGQEDVSFSDSINAVDTSDGCDCGDCCDGGDGGF